jgi:hypothetical protein
VTDATWLRVPASWRRASASLTAQACQLDDRRVPLLCSVGILKSYSSGPVLMRTSARRREQLNSLRNWQPVIEKVLDSQANQGVLAIFRNTRRVSKWPKETLIIPKKPDPVRSAKRDRETISWSFDPVLLRQAQGLLGRHFHFQS